jgi:hypothetical protein
MHWHIRDRDGQRLPGWFTTAAEADEAVDFYIQSGQFRPYDLIVFSCDVPTYHGWCG